MLRCVIASSSPDEALEKLCLIYPDYDRNELGQSLCDLLNQLIKEGVLDPNG